ncbi:MAG TPA: FKBP-type peptidyl-prolyl cis-trans isomerase [Bacteroidales bacterium]|nr:FKBP-type peptidyl-prolyl cis-trans isomerase [Bacteroidales bacterium]HOK75600.1 FKBP-type peptidyl-prolyl cis-trans isomerase [Bacteroidales bacterium]HOM39438.1 FKBP-type peptidyl-prolyl cis-trans isomerase [Bacteroidales bacterium]HOU30474.1 FKBP-type peptidyl-prolyl cis-trans isomerase [Bacteroidales bacterium]
MKKGIIILLILIPLILSAQKSKTKEPVKQSAGIITLSNAVDSSQYILGAYIGQYLRANNLVVTNPALFNKGLDDVLSGKPLLVAADTIPKIVNAYLSQAVIERNKVLEKQLFDAVKSQPGVGVLPSGVCYVIARAGEGARPLVADTVTIHIKGYLPDGTIFEDTYTRNTPLKARPENLIPGLKEAVQIMQAGSVWRVYIPSSLAYGEKGIPGIIPPFSALVFDVELLSINK